MGAAGTLCEEYVAPQDQGHGPWGLAAQLPGVHGLVE